MRAVNSLDNKIQTDARRYVDRRYSCRATRKSQAKLHVTAVIFCKKFQMVPPVPAKKGMANHGNSTSQLEANRRQSMRDSMDLDSVESGSCVSVASSNQLEEVVGPLSPMETSMNSPLQIVPNKSTPNKKVDIEGGMWGVEVDIEGGMWGSRWILREICGGSRWILRVVCGGSRWILRVVCGRLRWILRVVGPLSPMETSMNSPLQIVPNKSTPNKSVVKIASGSPSDITPSRDLR